MMADFFNWAYNHTDNTDPKYGTLSHSLYITITNTLLFTTLIFTARYSLVEATNYPIRSEAAYVGIFYLIYLGFMIATRYIQNGTLAIYEFLWACNQCLLVVGIGLILGDSFVIRASLIAVSVDQILWYVDIASYLITRKFVVGVAKYIVWPETSKLRLMTTFHHLWFLPLTLWQISPSAAYTTFTLEVYAFSCLMPLLLAFIGRISTPKQIVLKDGDKSRTVYMNINLSWELWKDVKVGFLTAMYKAFPSFAMTLVLSCIWNFLDLFGFALLRAIEALTSSK